MRHRVLVTTLVFSVSFAALASGSEFPYLGPAGAPANVFPRPERPVAKIISPSFSTEAVRDANKEANQVARLMGLKPGMTLADIGAGSGYHTVRLAPLLGPTGRSPLAHAARPGYQTLQHLTAA